MTREIPMPVASTREIATMTRTFALAAAVLLASISLATAQIVFPGYDSNANPIRGSYQTVVPKPLTGFENAFAASRPVMQAPARQLDGDADPTPGAR
jgi:hypothetical protein